jgi:TonB family protein
MYCCKNVSCGKNFGKRIAAFALALTLGLLAANFLRQEISVTKIEKVEKIETVKPVETKIETGKGESVGCSNYSSPQETEQTSPLKIFSKPQAKYTEEARKDNIQGSVVLRVTFLSNGKIGAITPVTDLPYGLTESAIAAARQICFEPAKRNGVPYAVAKTVVYSFTIY